MEMRLPKQRRRKPSQKVRNFFHFNSPSLKLLYNLEKKIRMWYADFYLIASNIFILPFVIRNFYYGRIDNGAIGLGVFLMSTFYHTAQTGLFIVESLEYAQNADHQWVTLLYWIVTLHFLQFNEYERFGIMICVLWLITGFPAHLVQTSAFFTIFIICSCFFVILQFFVRRKKFPRYGLMWFVLGTIVGLPALVFFFYNEGVNTPNYWWAHGSWHVLVMFSASIIDIGNDKKNPRFWKTLDRMDGIIEWEHGK